MSGPGSFPTIWHTVLDCPDARVLAEFYRQMFGLRYRPGYEPPGGEDPEPDWLVRRHPDGSRALAFRSPVLHLRRGPVRGQRRIGRPPMNSAHSGSASRRR